MSEAKPRSADWLVTARDVLKVCPNSFQVVPSLEKCTAEVILHAPTYHYEYENEVVINSDFTRDLSSFEANVGFAAIHLALSKFGFDPKETLDRSKWVRAGEESHCYRLRGRDAWGFTFRNRRNWGYFIIGGVPLREKDIQRLATDWITRQDRLVPAQGKRLEGRTPPHWTRLAATRASSKLQPSNRKASP